MRVEWSNSAHDDREDLVRYISRDSVFYARRFGEKIVLPTRRLRDFPESVGMISEAGDQTLREIIVHGYPKEACRVLILAVMHGRRKLD